jgi:hypothetical protein
MTDREFLFDYPFQGETYGVVVAATSPEEAKQRLWAMQRAEYKGEVFATVKVPGGGWLSRLMGWGSK